VLDPHDDRGSIENCAVKSNLLIEPSQGVFIALDLITNETPVHERNVRATPAVMQSEFVDHEHVRSGMIPVQNFPVEILSYQSVIHDSRFGQSRTSGRFIQHLMDLVQTNKRAFLNPQQAARLATRFQLRMPIGSTLDCVLARPLEFGTELKPCMKPQPRQIKTLERGLIKPPAYPWTARQLFGTLRAKLSEEERTNSMSFDRLAELVGISKSTTHHWFEVSPQTQVVAFLCWLERLSPSQRHAYIDAHCRLFPSLGHPCLAHAPAQVGRLGDLLRQERGLTLLTGGTESTRAFLVASLGHAYRRAGGKRQPAAGIDLHPPAGLVPVESLIYLDGTADLHLIRRLALKVWPRILTSSAGLLIFHGLWSSVPELRADIARCTQYKHVPLAEGGKPDLTDFENRVSTPVHVLTLSAASRFPGAIRVACRRLKNMPKGLKTRGLGTKAVQDIGHFWHGPAKGNTLDATDGPN
jgi:hypothetical protein